MTESPKLKQPKVQKNDAETTQPAAGGIPADEGAVPLAEHNAAVAEANAVIEDLEKRVAEQAAEIKVLESQNTALREELLLARARANASVRVHGVAKGKPVALHQISANGVTYKPTQEIPASIAQQLEEGVDFVHA